MKRLEKYLQIFDDEINKLINKEENPREFSLLRYDEIGKLTHIIEDVGKENLEVVYDPQTIEVYYNPNNLNKNFIQKPNFTNEILVKIFKYLAHHEYGHTFFCESTLTLVEFRNEIEDLLFNDFEDELKLFLRELFWILFHIFRDFYADFKAKTIRSIIPIYFLDLYYRAIEQFLRFNRINTRLIMNRLVEDFYSKVFYSSIWFYNFNQWEYLLKKCGENNKTESLRLILLLNKIFEAHIHKELDLLGYKESLTSLVVLLYKIDYDALFFENEINESTFIKLSGYLKSLKKN